MAKKKAADKPRYIPQMRIDEVEYVETDAPEGTPPFWARIRASLTPPEINGLVWDNDTPIEDVHALFAPFVLEWNLSGIDAKGEVVDVPAPAEAGGEQFQYLPNGLFWQLARDIKLKSTGRLDPKRNKQSVPTPDSANEASSSDET